MRNHTTAYEEAIKTFGRQQAIRITFGNVVLTGDDINSCTPSFKASLLKSCMKEVRIDSNTEIPVGTEIHLEHGILVGNNYEYLDYGYYTVYKVEKKEDTSSFDILCYDKMILAMVDYIDLEINFPITIRNYIAEICNHLEIDFGSNQDQFVNYDKEIPSELYLDENGDSLGYTFRDVLDELAQVTASVICIDNENKLVVKYPQRQGEFQTLEGTSLYISNADDSKIDLELKGNTTQDGTPTPDAPIEVNNVTGLQKVRVCRKNLFDVSSLVSKTYNGSSSTIRICNSQEIYLIPGTYTFSTNIDTSAYEFKSDVLKEPPTTPITETYIHNSGFGTSKTRKITISSAGYFAILIRNKNNTDLDLATLKNFKYQLEKGSSESDHQEYQGKDYEINLGKNLLKIYGETQTINGVTFTQNENGSISVKGTATANAFYSSTIVQKQIIKLNTNYRLSGCPSGGSTSTYRLIVRLKRENGQNIATVSDLGSGGNIRLTEEEAKKIQGEIYIYSGQSVDFVFYPQLEEGSQITDYAPYFEPIELNKIGNYQDFIRKGTGKNLADMAKLFGNTNFYSVTNNVLSIIAADNRAWTNLGDTWGINLKKGTYTLSTTNGGSTQVQIQGASSGQLVRGAMSNGTKSFTLTQDDLVGIKFLNISTYPVTIGYVQLEQNSSATLYEPYGYKDKWYIEKNVDKYILDKANTTSGKTYCNINTIWDEQNEGYIHFQFPQFIVKYNDGDKIMIADNRFPSVTIADRNLKAEQIFAHYSNGVVSITIEPSRLNGITSSSSATEKRNAFNTWLTSNPIIIDYVMVNPTYTLIENEELLNQLEVVQLQTGENNVLVSGDLPSTIKVGYVEEFKSIDEEQLKDINVNFGEKFGPINSVVIARAADSDFIYKEDEQSVEENGLCEIRISDNQILNGDSRVEFLNGIYYQLRGTEYYLNDFSSTGITYFDLLDFYKVKVFDNSYKCLMLNDDIKITQGIEEQVHTEMPETTETEYKALSKQDKDIRKIGIIVNKVEGEITAEVEARKGTDTKVSRISQTSSEINERLEATETTLYDSENGLVNKVTTHSLDIKKTADGLEIEVGRVDVLKDDVKALDDNTLDIRDNFLFNEDGLTIRNKGSDTQDMKLNLTNEAIKFFYQNRAVLTINGSKIEFSSASFEKLDLGNYVWQAEDDDSLSLIYEGD